MDDLNQLQNINWWQVILAIFVVVLAFKFVDELWQWFRNKLGIEFKWDRAKKKEVETMTDHEAKLNTIVSSVEVITDELDKLSTSISSVSDKIESLDNSMTETNKRIDNIDTRLDANNDANIMIFCDRLEQKCRMYIETLHGIPENEYQSFCDMFELYENGLHGNHGVDKKFHYCIENLPIIPSTLFLVRTDNLLNNNKK